MLEMKISCFRIFISQFSFFSERNWWILFTLTAYLSFSVAGNAADSLTEKIKRLYSEGEFFVGGVAHQISSIELPPFSISDSFETDVPYDRAYVKANGYPQRHVVNLYLLWPEQLDALGLQKVSNCIAQKDADFRYIFCNGPDLINSTIAFDEAIKPGGASSYLLARLILGHELIHHILRHTDRFETRRPSRSDLRAIEREADVATAQMFAERFQRQRLYDLFYPGQLDLETRSNPNPPTWIEGLLSIGSTHADWETRLRNHVITSADVFVDAKSYRVFEPVKLSLPGANCTPRSDCHFPKGEPTNAQLVEHWFSNPLQDREVIAAKISEIGTGRSLDQTGSYAELAMMCQAFILTGTPDRCAPVFDVYQESAMPIFNMVSESERVFGLQTMLMRRPETAEDAAVLVENFAAYAVDQLFRSWYAHKGMGPSPVYSYLSFLRGDNNTVDCGAAGEGFRPENKYDCGQFAAEVQASLVENPFSGLALFNIGLLLNLDREPDQVLFVTLAAVALTEPTRSAPIAGWLDLLSNVPPELLEEDENLSLFPMPQILYYIGMPSLALPYLDHLEQTLPKLIGNKLGLSQAWFEFGSDCLGVYLATCAIELFERSEQVRLSALAADPALKRNVEAYIDLINFAKARAHILRMDAPKALPLLEKALEYEERIPAQIGVYETIAEAHIMNCDGRAADVALRKAEALFDDPTAERDAERSAISAGYRNSINFLLGDKQALNESRVRVDKTYEAWIGLTPSGFNPMVGICNTYRRFNTLTLD